MVLDNISPQESTFHSVCLTNRWTSKYCRRRRFATVDLTSKPTTRAESTGVGLTYNTQEFVQNFHRLLIDSPSITSYIKDFTFCIHRLHKRDPHPLSHVIRAMKQANLNHLYMMTSGYCMLDWSVDLHENIVQELENLLLSRGVRSLSLYRVANIPFSTLSKVEILRATALETLPMSSKSDFPPMLKQLFINLNPSRAFQQWHSEGCNFSSLKAIELNWDSDPSENMLPTLIQILQRSSQLTHLTISGNRS